MKRRIIALLITVISLLAASSASAQMRTTDPVGDSLAFAAMRERLDSIRQYRPTVALVLSGGGAKGAAHVGVLKEIEKIGIPIDLVIGTSVGGLIGGLYSIGYTPEYMDTLFRSLDWSKMMSDKTDRKYKSYDDIKYNEKYILSMPFYYKPEDFLKSRKDDIQQDPGKRSLHLGAEGLDSRQMIRQNITGSLPSGFVYGQNIDYLFGGLTVGYQDSLDFKDLPIPFMCVATDIVTGRAKIWHSGNLRTALRSTMSIPGLFAPVRTDGMVLLDGGMRNNFPTDLAEACGADYIIGVTLSNGFSTYSEITNLGSIIMQSFDMFGMESYYDNVKKPDVTIWPDVSGYNLLSFDRESVDSLFARGDKAAREKHNELVALKEVIGESTKTLSNTPAIDINTYSIELGWISYRGITPKEVEFLRKKMTLREGQLITAKDIEDAMSVIYATGSFDYASYKLVGDCSPYGLEITCKRGPLHKIGIGARFDSETVVSALANISLNANKLEGHSFSGTLRLGSNPYALGQYAYKTAGLPTVNLDVFWGKTDANLYNLGNTMFNISYNNSYQKLYVSDYDARNGSLKAGISNEHINIQSFLSSETISEDVDTDSRTCQSFFAEARYNTTDDGYFPGSGLNMGMDVSVNAESFKDDMHPFYIAQLDIMKIFPVNERLALIPSFNTRMIFGNNIPLTYMNVAGGDIRGRYVRQQIPFMGVAYATPMQNKSWVVAFEARYKLRPSTYVSAVANILNSSQELNKDFFFSYNNVLGIGAQLGYNSVLGPVKFNVHWSSITKFGAYISVGYDF